MMSQVNTKKQKKKYSKPSIRMVKIDNEITTFMMSLPPDPFASNVNSASENNPFKIQNQG
jgi:hypothetical protein